MTTRVYPPVGGGNHDGSNGQRYIAAEGVSLDVPDTVANILKANGWTSVGFVGTTVQRPAKPSVNTYYVDTTLGLKVMWDGAHWRNEVTGAIA